jgi:hypothetical protein
LTSHNANLLEAVPINRLVCETSGITVGIEYRWNTGELAILWRDTIREDSVRLPIENRDKEPG